MKYLFLLVALPLIAQVESVKFRFGDDLHWAAPQFDDSGWDAAEDILATRSWARYKVRIPMRILDPVLGVDGSTMEVYVEGRLIGRHGKLPPEFEDSHRGYATFALPPDLAVPGTVITVALRMWDPPGSRFRGWNKPPKPVIHSEGETPSRARDSAPARIGRGYEWGAALILFALGLFGAAGRAQYKGREFVLVLLFGVALAGWCLSLALSYVYPLGRAGYLASGLFAIVFLTAAPELISVFAAVRPKWWWRSLQAAFILNYLAVLLAACYQDSPAWTVLAGPGFLWAGFLPSLAGVLAIAMQRADGLMARLFPITLTITLCSMGLARIARTFGYLQVRLGDIDVPFGILSFFLFAFTLVFVMLSRFHKTGAVALQLQGQIAAARSVQELLLLGKVSASPGYTIDPVYQPAEEVGGDFFRILAAPGNSTLLVVGDVSGKGLRAAMLVSVIIGALLNRRSSQPAAVLAELNHAIAGQIEGGFITCCAVLLQSNGLVLAANAGHIAPYVDGVEVAVEAGLPLGVVPEVSYVEVGLMLEPESQLMLVSDGVVEAENAQRELFGFDRTRDISTKSAQEIAQAAKAWGQNDDITVVTVRRDAQ